ncbi:unnamed protein product, partial [Phaeothamnion confervicola]
MGPRGRGLAAAVIAGAALPRHAALVVPPLARVRVGRVWMANGRWDRGPSDNWNRDEPSRSGGGRRSFARREEPSSRFQRHDDFDVIEETSAGQPFDRDSRGPRRLGDDSAWGGNDGVDSSYERRGGGGGDSYDGGRGYEEARYGGGRESRPGSERRTRERPQSSEASRAWRCVDEAAADGTLPAWKRPKTAAERKANTQRPRARAAAAADAAAPPRRRRPLPEGVNPA